MFKNLFALNPVVMTPESDSPDQLSLKRVLTARQLLMIGIGAIIGAGIFVITGTAAAKYAGPALTISFVIAGLTCALAALCYAEFASLLPISGSAYSYTYATLGELLAWFIGWNLILEYQFCSATVAVGWSGYFNSFLDVIHHWTGLDFTLPPILNGAPLNLDDTDSLVFTHKLINLPALLIICGITWLCYRGIKESISFTTVIVAIKLSIIVLFLIATFHYIHPSLWHPFIPPNEGGNSYGWPGIVRGSTLVFFAYIGFDMVSTAAGETKNPQRDMPIGILGSLVLCTLLYILMSGALTGLIPFRQLNTPDPIATTVDYLLGHIPAGSMASQVMQALKTLVVLAALAGLSSVILVGMMGQSRIFYTMSKDGLLPGKMSQIHRKNRTPYISSIIVGAISAVMASLLPINILGDMVSMGTLLAFAVVSLSVLVLRHTRPDLQRTFRVPAPWLICPLSTAACMYLFWQVFKDRWYLMLGWTTIGLLIYAFYGYHHSKLRQPELIAPQGMEPVTDQK